MESSKFEFLNSKQSIQSHNEVSNLLYKNTQQEKNIKQMTKKIEENNILFNDLKNKIISLENKNKLLENDILN